ncbi:MAG TPA: hypothetical protein VGM94_06215 [Galbitalea sp.]
MTFADWMFRSRKTGKITIGRPANRSQKLFQASTVVGVLLPKQTQAREIAGEVAVLSLAWWAADELLRGVNPFRRISGAVTLVAIAGLTVRAFRPGRNPASH